jgi:spore germination protein YaaH
MVEIYSTRIHLLAFLMMILFFTAQFFSQEIQKSIHQIENEYYQQNPHKVGLDLIPYGYRKNPDLENIEGLSNKIYGFHPYWISDLTASNYYYSLLTHIAYFGAEVDTSVSTTGNFSTTRNWATTQVVNYAKSFGVKVHLTIIMFDNHSRVLNNATYRSNLINNIITQINLRQADGCNIDFEGVAASQAANFQTFIFDLGTALKAINKELAICLPAVDWNNVFPTSFFNTVNSVVDYYFLMAYDYYWSGSSTAGPVAPLTTGVSTQHVTRSIRTYLSRNATAERLICGVPYYGYDWPVNSSNRMATATGTGASRIYTVTKSVTDTISLSNYFPVDAQFNVPWYRYISSGNWRQTWFDDSLSLSKKYDSIKTIGIAGTGIWALGYDGTNTELWSLLKNKFASTSNPLHTILANFEVGVGVFNQQPTFSGSTQGISVLSSSSRTTGAALNGFASLRVILKDSVSLTSNWQVRLLSGGGNPSNNQTLNSTGYIGFYMRTTSAPAGAQVALTIDDGAGGTELSPKLDVVNSNDWVLYQWNLQGTGWTSFSGGNGIINGPTITLDAIMFFAPNNSPDWTLFIDDVSYYQHAPLPVELSFFEGKVIDNQVHLFWATVTEKENFGWEIERAEPLKNKDSLEWEKLDFVIGSVSSNSLKHYSFIDRNVSSGIYYYRLKQINLDGSFEYSDKIEIMVKNLKEEIELSNYPNPFNSFTIIEFYINKPDRVRLSIFNLLGEEIKVLLDEFKESGKYKINFDADDLSSGVYIYKLEAGSQIVTRKMILLR